MKFGHIVRVLAVQYASEVRKIILLNSLQNRTN